MITRLRRHSVSFKHALEGIWHTFRFHSNFRLHIAAAILVILLGVYFKINSTEWLILVFTFNMILVAEMINTAMESVVDLIISEHHVVAKNAKDVSAGMVLISSVAAVIIGLFIFLPKFYSL